MELTFNKLRTANMQRLPEFKNNRGEAAHGSADGSDWEPALWLVALMGEVGEAAHERLAIARGEAFVPHAVGLRKECADIATYLDIFSRRCLDLPTKPVNGGDLESPAHLVMELIAVLGTFCNAFKKLRRGDLTLVEFEELRVSRLVRVQTIAADLRAIKAFSYAIQFPADAVRRPHATGVDLGAAVVEKFNETSQRVGSEVRL